MLMYRVTHRETEYYSPGNDKKKFNNEAVLVSRINRLDLFYAITFQPSIATFLC